MRHFVGLRHIQKERLQHLIDVACEYRRQVAEGQDLTHVLSGRAVALMFVEASTRTRFSFEMACNRLGAHPLAFNAASSSTTKGETLLDTARVLRQVGADVIVVRHKCVGAPQQLAQTLGLPIVSAGDGTNEHPTQALLDLVTLHDHFSTFKGLRVGVVGDVRHSRVARSLCFGLKKLGADVVVAGPGPLCTPDLTALGATHQHKLDDVIGQVDALMMLRIQRERLGGSMLASEAEYRTFWGLTEARSAQMQDHAIVLHPAPMNRGVEIDDVVADGPRSVIFDQMKNGVFARMAVLNDVMGQS